MLATPDALESDEAIPWPGAARSGRCTPSRRGPGDEKKAMSFGWGSSGYIEPEPLTLVHSVFVV